ncbi:MAG: glycosyltransferase family 39 protein, partial [Calditrichota bacterium]
VSLSRQTRTWLFLLMGGALIARLAVTLFFADNHTLYYEYMEIARNILDGHGYSWKDAYTQPLQVTSFLPPLYVFWCLFFIWLSSANFLPMYIAQAVVAATGCIPAYLVGKRFFTHQVGLIFATFYAIYPEFVYLHSRPVSEFLYVVLALWLLYGYTLLRDDDPKSRTSFRRSLWLGLLFGVTILVKEGATVLLTVIALSLLIAKRPRATVLRRSVVPMVAVAVLVVLPWTIRNYVAQGKFIPIRTGFGYTLWVGNHPGGNGLLWLENGSKTQDDLPEDYKAYVDRNLPNDEQARDSFYFSEVGRFIRSNPLHYADLCLRRLGVYLWFDPTHPLAQNIIYRISYILTLVLAIPGIILAIRRKQMDPIFPLTYFGYLLLYVPVLVLPRYRIIPLLVLLLMSAFSFHRLFERKEWLS